MKLELYPWQKECLDIWSAHGHRGIVNVITGAGKTILAIAAIRQLKQFCQRNLRVRIVVPTTHLLSQWSSALLDVSLPDFSASSAISRQEISYYYGARKDPEDRSYTIYVINSARYALARHILNDIRQGYDVFLIADECHHYASRENKKIFEFLPFISKISDDAARYYSLGLSATPQTAGYASVLVPSLGEEIYRYGFTEAVDTHTISRFAIFQITLSFQLEEEAAYQALSERISHLLNRLHALLPSLMELDSSQFFARLNALAGAKEGSASSLASSLLALIYQRKSLVCNAAARLSCTCRLIDSLNPHDKIILFGERIEQADAICRLLSAKYPGQVGRYHSQLEAQAKKNTLERYRNGEIRILASCRALDEGFDIPSANVGIILSSTDTERQRIQRLGRILRPAPDKGIASLYYLSLGYPREEPSFLSQLPREAFCGSLSYSCKSDTFSFPEYEEKAVQVLAKIRQTSADEAVCREASKCLLMGLLRPDRFLENSLLEKKLADAKTNSERNYWLCMKQMAALTSSCIQEPGAAK